MPLIKRFPPVTNQRNVDIWELARQTLLPRCFSTLPPVFWVFLGFFCLPSLFFSLVFSFRLTFTFTVSFPSARSHPLLLFLLLFLPPSLSISPCVAVGSGAKLTKGRQVGIRPSPTYVTVSLCSHHQRLGSAGRGFGLKLLTLSWDWSAGASLARSI